MGAWAAVARDWLDRVFGADEFEWFSGSLKTSNSFERPVQSRSTEKASVDLLKLKPLETPMQRTLSLGPRTQKKRGLGMFRVRSQRPKSHCLGFDLFGISLTAIP